MGCLQVRSQAAFSKALEAIIEGLGCAAQGVRRSVHRPCNFAEGEMLRRVLDCNINIR